MIDEERGCLEEGMKYGNPVNRRISRPIEAVRAGMNIQYRDIIPKRSSFGYASEMNGFCRSSHPQPLFAQVFMTGYTIDNPQRAQTIPVYKGAPAV